MMRTTDGSPTIINKWGGLVLIVAGIAVGSYVSLKVTLLVLAIAGVLTVHELGHFLTARLTGMKATQFFLGFGPRLWSFHRGETEYGLRLLPLGAFVRIIGITSDEKVEPADERRTYRVKSFPRRALVISAGSAAHFLMAFLALVALHGIFGNPVRSPDNWEVAEVPAILADGTSGPAYEAGIQPGDRISRLNGEQTIRWPAFVDGVRSRPGQTVDLVINRDGELIETSVRIATNTATGQGRIGIAASAAIDYPTAALPVATLRSAGDFGYLSWQSIWSIGRIFGNVDELADRIISAPNDPTANENIETRPLSIVGLVQVSASERVSTASDFLSLFIAFNIFIGVFNLLPLLPFDGGHLAIAIYERWRERGGRDRHMVDMKKLTPLVYAVTIALLILAVGLVYLDVANPINL